MPAANALRLGAWPQLVADWAAEVRMWRQRWPHRAVVTVVPSPALAVALRRWAPDVAADPAVELIEWPRALDRADLPPLPEAAAAVLAAHCPPARFNLPADIPGLYDTVIQAALECRRAGLGRRELAKFAVPWAPVLDWLAEVLGPLRLERQAYQYAAGGKDAPAGVGFFALGEVPPAAVDRLLAMAAGAERQVHWLPWMAGGAAAVRRRRADWIRRGFRPERLAGGEPKASPALWVARTPEEAAAWALAAAQAADGEATAVVVAAADWMEVLAGAGAQPLRLAGWGGWRFEHTDAAQTWQWFWRVASGRAGRAEVVRWLERAAPGPTAVTARRAFAAGAHWRSALASEGAWQWARQWHRALLAVPRWEALMAAVRTAADRLWPGCLPPPVTAWLGELARYTAFDRVGLAPTAALIEGMLARPSAPLADEGEAGPWPVLAAQAPYHGCRRLVAVMSGAAPPRWDPPGGRLLSGPARRGLGLEGAAEGERLWRYRWALMTDWAQAAVVVAAGEPIGWPAWLRERLRPAPPAAASAPRRPPERAPAWYQARAAAGWTPFDGTIGGAAAAALPATVSATALERYGRCPLQYFFADVLQLPAAADSEPADVDPALWGQWAHGALAELTRTRSNGSRAAVTAAVEAAAAALPPPPSVPAGIQRATVALLVEDLVEAWRRHPPVPAAATVDSERELLGTWGNLRLRVRLDRLERSPETVRIIDYKTGRIPDPDHLAPDQLQLAVYRWVTAQALGVPGEGVAAEYRGVSARNLWAVRIPRRPWAETAAQLQAMLAEATRRWSEGRFHPLPHGNGGVCLTCSYRLLCPAEVDREARRKRDSDPEFAAYWEKESTAP